MSTLKRNSLENKYKLIRKRSARSSTKQAAPAYSTSLSGVLSVLYGNVITAVKVKRAIKAEAIPKRTYMSQAYDARPLE